jgi:hypothetical protein
LALAAHVGACAIVVRFAPHNLALGPFLFFGGDAGMPLPDIAGFKIARRKTRNVQGERPERPGVRCVNLSTFATIQAIEGLADKLFGPASAA